MEKLIKLITAQQQGHHNDDVFMVGEQLKDMARQEPHIAEILAKDLEVADMALDKATAKIKEYSDKNRGNKQCFCVTPIVAEKILRDFYCLPQRTKDQEFDLPVQKIDLGDFL